MWPLVAAGLLAITSAAQAEPAGSTPLIMVQAAPEQPTAKPKAAADSKPDQKTKTGSKKTDAKAKPDAKPAKEKAAAKAPATKTEATKTEKKPSTDKKAAAKSAAKPAPAKGKGAGSLAPPIAAALKPTLPNEEDAAASPAPTGQPSAVPAPANTIITAAAIDVAAVKRAVEMVRNRKQSEANETRKNISDPTAKKLVEWVILRSDDSGSDFARFAAFIAANPTWPSIVTLRRKAEAAAFSDRPDNAQLQSFFSR